jgi:hypothetical protein
MKHWTELNNLETQLIRLDSMRSLFSMMASGAEESSSEDIRNAMWFIESSLNDITHNLRSDFNDLWEVVKNDVEKEEKKHKGGMKKKKQMTDRELP